MFCRGRDQTRAQRRVDCFTCTSIHGSIISLCGLFCSFLWLFSFFLVISQCSVSPCDHFSFICSRFMSVCELMMMMWYITVLMSCDVNDFLSSIFSLQRISKHSVPFPIFSSFLSPLGFGLFLFLAVELLGSPSPPPQRSLGISSHPPSPMDTSALPLITVETYLTVCSQQASVHSTTNNSINCI